MTLQEALALPIEQIIKLPEFFALYMWKPNNETQKPHWEIVFKGEQKGQLYECFDIMMTEQALRVAKIIE